MTLDDIVIEGTLKPDGTLELDHKPNLPPGRVTVTLRPTVPPAQPREDWWQYLQRIRAEREAAGYAFMNDQEMQSHIAQLREDDDRMDHIYREIEQDRRNREKH
jgi:hypothetical protein